jgi:hypothetical protein
MAVMALVMGVAPIVWLKLIDPASAAAIGNNKTTQLPAAITVPVKTETLTQAGSQ